MSSVHPFDSAVHTGAVIYGGKRSSEGRTRDSSVVSQVALLALSETQIADPASVIIRLPVSTEETNRDVRLPPMDDLQDADAPPTCQTYEYLTNNEFEGFEYNYLDQKPTVPMYGEEIPEELAAPSPKPVLIMQLLDLRRPVKGIAMRANKAAFEKPRFTALLKK
jgi:hypothetical protein